MKNKKHTRLAELPRMAASLKAAASYLGSSVETLRWCKGKGCPGFRSNGSVELLPVKEWMVANPPPKESESMEGLRKRKLRAECEAKERDNAVRAGELIGLAEYIEINARIDGEIAKGLDGLADEMGPKVFGMKTVAEIIVKLKEATDRIKDSLHSPIRDPKQSGAK